MRPRSLRAWAAAVLLVATWRSVTATPSATPPTAARLRIVASSASSGGSKSFFAAETAQPAAAARPSDGFLWPAASSHANDDDRDDGSDDEVHVKPFTKHWKIKLAHKVKAPFNEYEDDDEDDNLGDDDDSDAWIWRFGGGAAAALPSQSLHLSVDVAARTFVRAMAASDATDNLVARVVVRADAHELADSALSVFSMENATAITSDIAFRVSTVASAAAPLSGCLLVQVLVNTKLVHLASLNVTGRSVVVVEDSALVARSLFSDVYTPHIVASGSAKVFVPLESAVRATVLTLRAEDAAALVVQARANVILTSLELQQSGRATLALAVQRLACSTVSAGVRASAVDGGHGGAVCFHSASPSATDAVVADVASDDGLFEWTSQSDSVCSTARIHVRGANARADVSALRSGIVNVTVVGAGSSAAVYADDELKYSVSPDARVEYVSSRPETVVGSGGRVGPAPAVAASTPPSRCSLVSLTTEFPLPLERAVFVVLPPLEPPPREERSIAKSQRASDRAAARQAAHDAVQRRQPASVALPDLAATTSSPLAVDAPPPVAPLGLTEPASGAVSAGDTQSPPPSEPSASSSSSTSSFVNGSLHMLGSIPYVDAIVVFLASAWILHHLLQCYDRRQRRRAYTPLATPGTADARVWI